MRLLFVNKARNISKATISAFVNSILREREREPCSSLPYGMSARELSRYHTGGYGFGPCGPCSHISCYCSRTSSNLCSTALHGTRRLIGRQLFRDQNRSTKYLAPSIFFIFFIPRFPLRNTGTQEQQRLDSIVVET